MDSAWDIESLIPHRDRMKLIDAIESVGEDVSTTITTVTDRWPLYRDAAVDPIVLIEVVAQTAAVHVSAKPGKGPTRKGWLVGIKSADFFRNEVPEHTVLTTTVRNLYEIDQYTVLEGDVRTGEERLAHIQIQVLREGEAAEAAVFSPQSSVHS